MWSGSRTPPMVWKGEESLPQHVARQFYSVSWLRWVGESLDCDLLYYNSLNIGIRFFPVVFTYRMVILPTIIPIWTTKIPGELRPILVPNRNKRTTAIAHVAHKRRRYFQSPSYTSLRVMMERYLSVACGTLLHTLSPLCPQALTVHGLPHQLQSQ